MFNNIPILLTWARILLIPVVIGVFYVPADVLSIHHKNVFACVVFVVAALTDWFDGYLARSWGQTSNFGAFLDPVADKLMVSAALAVLLQLDRCDALVAFVIIGREITISALREWMAKIGASKSVAVSFVGKLKTTAQMVAIPMLLYHDDLLGLPIQIMGTVLIVVAAVLTVWSMIYYLRKAAPDLRRES
ncbi:MAG: CDP-diacylglycerol--glycerol-3-phosphate 3-phosphatidyltransferase [Rhodocyclales bacterium]|nr:CDP-diacylglycerol--glycerol-3-phosphate 3-phosphatidyltransferase [Rhodocyclales bacterium]